MLARFIPQEGKRYGDILPSDGGTLEHRISKGSPSLKADPDPRLPLGDVPYPA